MIVYLDTNVYYGAKFVFDRGKFETLKTLLNDGIIKVLYTSATKGEVLQHIEEDITKEITAYNRAIRKNLSSFKIDEDLSIQEISIHDFVRDRKDKLQSFFDLANVESISLNPLNAEMLMDDYFNMNPPFESKKPHEFKDAIMINAIRNYQRAANEKICIVSDDAGFRKAFEENANFICFEYLSYFFNYIQEERALNTYYSSLIANGFFEDEIENYLEALDIDRGDYSDWECDSKELRDLDCELLYIERDRNPEKLQLHIQLNYDIDVEISHRDDDLSYYDKEEHRYLFEEYVTWLERHTLSEEIIVLCSIVNDGEYFEFEKIISDRKYDFLDLCDDTMYDFDEISSTQNEDPNLVYCAQCGRIIGHTPIYFDYDGEPLCGNCMIDDTEGMVCPDCGRKVPYEKSINGFCEDCAKER